MRIFFQRYPAYALLAGVLMLLNACGNTSNESHDMEQYFAGQVKERMMAFDKLPARDSVVKKRVAEIDRRVGEIILMSRDVENLQASVNVSNGYFSELSKEFGLNEKDFNSINTGMHVNEIAVILRQNELNLFNQLLFRLSDDPVIYTAH
jgi:hypothetical protein